MTGQEAAAPAAPLVEDEILYYYDGPQLLTLRDGETLWIAICVDHDAQVMHYKATEVSRAEIEAITTGKMSVRGGFLGKPWRPVELEARGFFFREGGGPEIDGAELSDPGVGLSHEWKDLPDHLPGAPLRESSLTM